MSTMQRIVTAALVLAGAVRPLGAQEEGGEARQAYFRAVAEFFSLPSSEVSILGDWRLDPDEVPVALFVAHRAGVSPEAVVALRRSGTGWAALAKRYQLDAAQFYVPISRDAGAGPLQRIYDRFQSLPADQWGTVQLSDPEIVGLVNVRILAHTLKMPADSVLARAGDDSWVDLYLRLLRRGGNPGGGGGTR